MIHICISNNFPTMRFTSYVVIFLSFIFHNRNICKPYADSFFLQTRRVYCCFALLCPDEFVTLINQYRLCLHRLIQLHIDISLKSETECQFVWSFISKVGLVFLIQYYLFTATYIRLQFYFSC